MKTKIITKNGKVFVERFTPFRRVEHMFGMIIFILLCLTGFPQKFYEASWAVPLLNFFGGLDMARFLHRLCGFLFAFHSFLHIGMIVVGTLRRKMELTLLITPQDFVDVIRTLKYYFGINKEKPVFNKFDYRQKFEYLGVVLGGTVMILTGFMLLYPMTFAEFLPGQFIAAAKIMHTNEALLALGVIITWHIYGSHFSPDVFPMDKSIFTGLMSKEDLKHHHYLEYKKIFENDSKGAS